VFLIINGERLDFDLDVLKDVLLMLDGQLERVYAYGETVEDPDGFGVYDTAEHLIGLGFAACQTYQASTYGFLGTEKRAALKLGPEGSPGHTFAELVNDAANFWKHHDEWQLNPNSRGERDTIEGLAAMGCAEGEHPLTRALAALVRPRRCRLEPLLTRLEAWRDALPLPARKPPSP
jgi:hypothetical protein